MLAISSAFHRLLCGGIVACQVCDAPCVCAQVSWRKLHSEATQGKLCRRDCRHSIVAIRTFLLVFNLALVKPLGSEDDPCNAETQDPARSKVLPCGCGPKQYMRNIPNGRPDRCLSNKDLHIYIYIYIHIHIYIYTHTPATMSEFRVACRLVMRWTSLS